MNLEIIHVLAIEDNPADFRLMKELFKENPAAVNYELTQASTLKEAADVLASRKFDVVLLDLNLPDGKGLGNIDKLLSLNQSLPIILITGTDDEKIGIKALQKGAQDYLVKGSIESGLLIRSIRYAIERQRAEEVLKRDKETFERLVQERTKALVEAQVELEKTKRLSDIGVLAATVAHELRNPLAAINMAAANIRRKANNSLLERHLASIEKKVLESDQIINNLLYYSRIRAPRCEDVKINDIIDEVIVLFMQQFSLQKQIFMRKEMRLTEGLLIEVDPLQIKEVIANIFNNAFDALPESGGKIDIVTHKKPEAIEIHIFDSGIGIDKEHLDKVFDPFFTTKAKGTGLGLAVCQQIVKMHNGRIDIESQPGQGTKIRIVLPVSPRIDKPVV